MNSFRTVLESGAVMVLDGAMGTELVRRGVESVATANLSHPDVVRAIHEEYFKAGSNAAITNTLTMNRIFVESHGINVDVHGINIAGAAIARSCAMGKGFVLGNLSSTGQMLEPYGTYTEADFVAAFKEQAGFLQEGGVEGFIIETLFDLREAVCALNACKEVSSLPVVVAMSFSTEQNDGRTVMGNSALDCAHRLTEEGADALGANCGSIDPLQMAEVVRILSRATRLPIVAESNAGKPTLLKGKTEFDMDPAAFALGMLKCRHAGARLIGGCCGTTPDHIRALTRALAT